MTGAEMIRRLMDNWYAILRRAATGGPYAYAVLPDRIEKRWP